MYTDNWVHCNDGILIALNPPIAAIDKGNDSVNSISCFSLLNTYQWIQAPLKYSSLGPI